MATNITKEDVIEQFRKIIDGEIRASSINKKDRRKLKVLLKSMGIEVDNW